MINFIINDQNFSDYVDEFQFTDAEITGGNEFTTASGEQVKNITGHKLSLKIKLKQLDTKKLTSATAILGNESITVQSDFPNAAGQYANEGGYTVNNTYNDRKKAEWEIDFTLSRTIKAGSGDGL